MEIIRPRAVEVQALADEIVALLDKYDREVVNAAVVMVFAFLLLGSGKHTEDRTKLGPLLREINRSLRSMAARSITLRIETGPRFLGPGGRVCCGQGGELRSALRIETGPRFLGPGGRVCCGQGGELRSARMPRKIAAL